MRIGGGGGNATGEAGGAMLYLTRPGDGTGYPMITGTVTAVSDDARTVGGHVSWHRTAVITLDRVQMLMHTGNVSAGRMTVWGIAHA